MTSEGYRAIVRSLGLAPCRPSFDGKTLHYNVQTKTYQQVVDPEPLSPDEREAEIQLLKFLLGAD
jgi:hypothetical protein